MRIEGDIPYAGNIRMGEIKWICLYSTHKKQQLL